MKDREILEEFVRKAIVVKVSFYRKPGEITPEYAKDPDDKALNTFSLYLSRMVSTPYATKILKDEKKLYEAYEKFRKQYRNKEDIDAVFIRELLAELGDELNREALRFLRGEVNLEKELKEAFRKMGKGDEKW